MHKLLQHKRFDTQVKTKDFTVNQITNMWQLMLLAVIVTGIKMNEFEEQGNCVIWKVFDEA